MIEKDGKKYYTMEEAREISNKHIEQDAKAFAKKVLAEQSKMQNV